MRKEFVLAVALLLGAGTTSIAVSANAQDTKEQRNNEPRSRQNLVREVRRGSGELANHDERLARER